MKMEDIPQVISATAQTVGQKAVGLWEEGRLVIRIKDLEREMNCVYAEIGKKQVECARAQFDAETENQAGMLDAMKDCPDYNKIIASYADNHLHLAIAQGKSLQIANTFKAPDFTTAEYFIFSALKKLQLNPEISTITFRTPISNEQEMSLYRYFKAVEVK